MLAAACVFGVLRQTDMNMALRSLTNTSHLAAPHAVTLLSCQHVDRHF